MQAENDVKMHFLRKNCTQILALVLKKKITSKLLSLNQNIDVVRWFMFAEDPHITSG